ncbi:MAG: hypothetical protein ACYDBH_07310 [Acidobacteriaceae bacterium]
MDTLAMYGGVVDRQLSTQEIKAGHGQDLKKNEEQENAVYHHSALVDHQNHFLADSHQGSPGDQD